MAKWASTWPGLGGLGLMKLGDFPRWLAFNFSVKDLSVALGNIDSSSRMESRPRGWKNGESSNGVSAVWHHPQSMYNLLKVSCWKTQSSDVNTALISRIFFTFVARNRTLDLSMFISENKNWYCQTISNFMNKSMNINTHLAYMEIPQPICIIVLYLLTVVLADDEINFQNAIDMMYTMDSFQYRKKSSTFRRCYIDHC